VRVRFLGSGDAFASGGRLQTCILVESDGKRLVVTHMSSDMLAHLSDLSAEAASDGLEVSI
jgi:hypothetical protein